MLQVKKTRVSDRDYIEGWVVSEKESEVFFKSSRLGKVYNYSYKVWNDNSVPRGVLKMVKC